MRCDGAYSAGCKQHSLENNDGYPVLTPAVQPRVVQGPEIGLIEYGEDGVDEGEVVVDKLVQNTALRHNKTSLVVEKFEVLR